MKAIIKSIILKQIRKPGYLIFTVIFPIILALVIGNVVGDSMVKDIKLENKVVYYTSDGSNEISYILDDIAKNDTLLNFKKINDKVEAKNSVSTNGSIFIDAIGGDIKVYVDNGDSSYYSYIKSLLQSYNSRFRVVNIINENAPEKFMDIVSDTKIEAVENEVLSGKSTPIGVDYYGVASLTMIILYMVLFPLEGIFDDKKRRIYERVKVLGISSFKYIFASLIGYFILSVMMIGTDIIFMKYVLGINFGNSAFIVYLGMCSFSLVSLIVGTSIGYLVSDKSRDISLGILQGAIIPVIAFLGGAYIQIPYGSFGVFNPIFDYSPLRVLNKGIFDCIYLGNYKTIFVASFIYFLIAMVGMICLVKFVKSTEEARI